MISQWLLAAVMAFEGFSPTAYLDPVDVWTIGYGHIENVKEGDVITQEEAKQLLIHELKEYKAHVDTVNVLCGYEWKDHQIDALTSFAYNIGSIYQLTNYCNRSNEVIAERMLWYYNADGKKLNGLVKRRQIESEHFIGD